MTPIPLAPRPLLAVAGFFALAVTALAQPAKADVKITLSRTPDGSTPLEAPTLRPNGQLKLFVIVTSTVDLPEQTFRVELLEGGPAGSPLVPAKVVRVEKGKPTAIAFDPPPPKKEAPKKEDPAPKKDAEPAPKAAEPPPGLPLKLTESGPTLSHRFTVKVWNDPQKAADKPVAERTYTVNIQRPTAYLVEPTVTLTTTGGTKKGITAEVMAPPPKADPDKKDAPPPVVEFIPPVDVALVFPPQLGLKTTALRAGTYQRKIFRAGQKVELSATDLPFTGLTNTVKFYLNVDGFLRAYTYTLDVTRVVDKDEPTQNKIAFDPRDKPVVRLFPVSASRKARVVSALVASDPLETPTYPTLPTKDLRFRVEVDHPPQDATLELRVDRTGNRSFLNPDEVIPLGLPRDERVWLEPGGEGGAWTISNTVTDHVAGVDVSALRGAHAFQAVLKLDGKDLKTAEYTLIVDETPPPEEEIDFDYTKFPTRLVKGTPFEVRVLVDDPESGIDRVTLYLAKPGPDGIIPDGTPKFEAVRQRIPTVWVAAIQLPVPPPVDPKALPVPKAPAVVDVTAVAENGVGLTTPKVVRIELVDPKGGTIAATIKRGTRPQPGVEVTLRDADGKEKGVLKTNEKGVALFVNLPPGPYRLYAGKPDASTGLVGNTVATIPDPPGLKPIPVDLDLAKRR